jgi:hypothetical protein
MTDVLSSKQADAIIRGSSGSAFQNAGLIIMFLSVLLPNENIGTTILVWAAGLIFLILGSWGISNARDSLKTEEGATSPVEVQHEDR